MADETDGEFPGAGDEALPAPFTSFKVVCFVSVESYTQYYLFLIHPIMSIYQGSTDLFNGATLVIASPFLFISYSAKTSL